MGGGVLHVIAIEVNLIKSDIEIKETMLLNSFNFFIKLRTTIDFFFIFLGESDIKIIYVLDCQRL